MEVDAVADGEVAAPGDAVPGEAEVAAVEAAVALEADALVPRMVRSPMIRRRSSSAVSIAVAANVMSGWRSTSKRSSERRWASRGGAGPGAWRGTF